MGVYMSNVYEIKVVDGTGVIAFNVVADSFGEAEGIFMDSDYYDSGSVFSITKSNVTLITRESVNESED